MIWKYFYSLSSSSQHGTLFQLRNLIGRTNVKGKPIDCFDPSEDFFVLIVEAHIIVAAMTLLEMTTMGDVPSTQYLPFGEMTWTQTNEERKIIVDKISAAVVDNFVSVDYNGFSSDTSATQDGVFSYATKLLTLGCFYLEFRDAIKEGDGLRVLRCYRYMLPMFISSGRKNYAIETLNLLLQYDFLLSPQLAEELIWGRFINTHGQAGKNIPNDLHCEHLNRLCKGCITDLQANKTEESISRVARALGTIHPVLNRFDTENKVSNTAPTHHEVKQTKDLKMVVELLKEVSVFSKTFARKHVSFSRPRDPLHAMSYNETVKWIEDHIKSYFQQ